MWSIGWRHSRPGGTPAGLGESCWSLYRSGAADSGNGPFFYAASTTLIGLARASGGGVSVISIRDLR